MRSSAARAQPTAIAATSGRVLSKVAMAPAKPCLTSTSGEPRRFSFGTRQFSKMIVAVSEARMPSLCSSRSTRMPGRALGDDERLDRGAAELAVERRPDDDVVGAVARGDVDLLAVDDVLVAVEDGGRLDVGRVGADAGLGDRHAGPHAVEALELLVVGDRGDGGVAEALARHREQQADVAPAHLGDRHHRGEVGAVLDGLVAVPRPRGGRRPRRHPRPRRTRRARRSSRRACRAPWGTRARRGRTCARSDAACSSRPGGPGPRAAGTSSGRPG